MENHNDSAIKDSVLETCLKREDLHYYLLFNMTLRNLEERHDDLQLVRILSVVFQFLSWTLKTTATFFGLSNITFVPVAFIVSFLLWNIIVPYNSIVDLDLASGVNTRRRDLVNVMRKLRKVGKSLPPPFPNSWYAMIESVNLKTEQVKHINCFGENLALFRSSQGVAYCVDAYCPHLGADMTRGGMVRGDCLECPFHRWHFSGATGKCVSIPNTDSVPNNATIKSWEVREIDGMVFVWYSVEDNPPAWEITDTPEITSGKWWYMGRNEFLVPCHIQDVGENGSDMEHLNAVHGDHVLGGWSFPVPEFLNLIGKHVWTGTWRPTETPHIAELDLIEDWRLFGKISLFKIRVRGFQTGPNYVKIEISNWIGRCIMLQSTTSIAPLLQRIIHRIYAPIYLKPFISLFMWAETLMFYRDAVIWSHKKYENQPVYVKADRTIKGFRVWSKQFYSEHSISFHDAIKDPENQALSW